MKAEGGNQGLTTRTLRSGLRSASALAPRRPACPQSYRLTVLPSHHPTFLPSYPLTFVSFTVRLSDGFSPFLPSPLSRAVRRFGLVVHNRMPMPYNPAGGPGWAGQIGPAGRELVTRRRARGPEDEAGGLGQLGRPACAGQAGAMV